jgi:hypothetical protein
MKTDGTRIGFLSDITRMLRENLRILTADGRRWTQIKTSETRHNMPSVIDWVLRITLRVFALIGLYLRASASICG